MQKPIQHIFSEPKVLLPGGAHAAASVYAQSQEALVTPPKVTGALSLRGGRPPQRPLPGPILLLPMVVMVDTEKKKEPTNSQRPMLVVLSRTMSPFW